MPVLIISGIIDAIKIAYSLTVSNIVGLTCDCRVIIPECCQSDVLLHFRCGLRFTHFVRDDADEIQD